MIAQLASIEPAQILSEAPDAIWLDSDKKILLLRAPEELATSEDGHLGYTQLLRICEIARYAFWRELLPPNEAVTGCIVVHLEMTCRKKVITGMLVGIDANLISLGRTSFTMAITFRCMRSGAELTNFRLTLVALNDDGQPIPLRQEDDHVNDQSNNNRGTQQDSH